MAAQAEVLVQIADVLGDAAGERVDVRRDQPDLHRSRFSAPAPACARSAVSARPWSATSAGGRPASIAARRSAAVRPGNDVQPVPIAAASWLSLLPTVGRP